MAELDNFPEWLRALRERLGYTRAKMAEETALSANYLYQLESGARAPSDSARKLFELLERAHAAKAKAGTADEVVYDAGLKNNRRIPVVSWAHAGAAEVYDEIPKHWQEWVPTDCRDDKAFALRLVGDSMAREFLPGDLLIVQPSEEIYSGCLAVIRFANDGIVFRSVEVRKDHVILVPLNERYEREQIELSEISWAYPVWGMWRQVWK